MSTTARDLAIKMINLNGYTHSIENQNKDKDNSINIKFTGIRNGEKIFEELFYENNSDNTTHPKILKSNEGIEDIKKLDEILIDLKKIQDTYNYEETKNFLIKNKLITVPS